MKDPATYLRELGIKLECPVHPGAPTLVDTAHRAYVGHDIFFVSSDEALADFIKHPVRYCGILTDPVTGARFRPSKSSPRFEFSDRPYFFASADSRRTFEADPIKYANPMRPMKPATPAPANQPTQPTQPTTTPEQPAAPPGPRPEPPGAGSHPSGGRGGA